jgi:ferredoxin-type protein NapF
LGIAAAVLPRVDWAAKASSARERVLKISGERLIRPPGSEPVNAFVAACVRCGECMAVCPTNTLQPALGEGGWEALGTPILVPRLGPCAQDCEACGKVCPTGAIKPFSVAEKSYLFVGTAAVDRSACIAWAEGKQCVVCDEACSYDAIRLDVENEIGRPVVEQDICVGCGLCEFVCPVEPRSAIRVNASGDSRHQTRAEQRARWEAARRQRDRGEQESGGGSPYPG